MKGDCFETLAIGVPTEEHIRRASDELGFGSCCGYHICADCFKWEKIKEATIFECCCLLVGIEPHYISGDYLRDAGLSDKLNLSHIASDVGYILNYVEAVKYIATRNFNVSDDERIQILDFVKWAKSVDLISENSFLYYRLSQPNTKINEPSNNAIETQQQSENILTNTQRQRDLIMEEVGRRCVEDPLRLPGGEKASIGRYFKNKYQLSGGAFEDRYKELSRQGLIGSERNTLKNKI